MVDKDGTFTYSPVRVVNFDNESSSHIFPNPVKGKTTLYYESGKNANTAQLRLTNTLGQQVKQLNLATNSDNFLLDVSELPNGVYHCSIYMNGERVEAFKMLVLK